MAEEARGEEVAVEVAEMVAAEMAVVVELLGPCQA